MAIHLDNSFILAADGLDLSKHGLHFVGKDEGHVSYFAEVAHGDIIGYVCKNSAGEIIPSFVITKMTVRPVDVHNKPTHLVIEGITPLDTGPDGGAQVCCHVNKGTLFCHPIKCPI